MITYEELSKYPFDQRGRILAEAFADTPAPPTALEVLLTNPQRYVLETLISGNGHFVYADPNDYSCDDGMHIMGEPRSCNCRAGWHAEAVMWGEDVMQTGHGEPVLWGMNRRASKSLLNNGLLTWDEKRQRGWITKTGRAALTAAPATTEPVLTDAEKVEAARIHGLVQEVLNEVPDTTEPVIVNLNERDSSEDATTSSISMEEACRLEPATEPVCGCGDTKELHTLGSKPWACLVPGCFCRKFQPAESGGE